MTQHRYDKLLQIQTQYTSFELLNVGFRAEILDSDHLSLFHKRKNMIQQYV